MPVLDAQGARLKRSARTAKMAVVTLVLACVGVPGEAVASELRVRTRTVGEAYVVQSGVDPGILLRRRRLAQYVSLGVYDILPPTDVGRLHRDADQAQLHIVTSMRLRHDFGDFRTGAGPRSGPYIESMDGRQIDMLYGYIEGRRMAKGWVDFRAGRQFEQGGLDWYVYDGGFFRLRLPVHVGLEVFGGLQAQGDQLFGYPNFDLDGTNGTRLSDRAIHPMVGAGASIIDWNWMDAGVSYRRTMSAAPLGEELVDAAGDPLEPGIDEEFVSARASMRLAKGKVSPHFALRYDLGHATVTDLSVGGMWSVTKRHRARAQFLRTVPRFDLDSIFNVFAANAFEDLRFSWEVDVGPRWTLATRGQARWFHDQETSSGRRVESDGIVADDNGLDGRASGGAGVSAVYRRPRFAMRLDSQGLTGEGGTQVAGSVDTRTYIYHRKVALDGRLWGVYHDDDQRAERRGHALAVQIGLDFRLWRAVHLAVMGEELFSPYLRHSLRLWAAVSADFSLRAGSR